MPIITISRGTLSGGRKLADQLGARLGFKVVSQQELNEALNRYDITPEDHSKEMTETGSLWHRLTHPGQKARHLQAVRAILLELLASGDGIYHGHTGYQLLTGLSKVVKLRLIAPMSYRVRAAMEELGLSEGQAVEHIEAVDELRVKWVRQLYGVEWHDPALYDLVINLEMLTLETAVEMVAHLAEEDAYRSTPESMQEFLDLSLAARVRAELLFNSGHSGAVDQVHADAGVVTLTGGDALEAERWEISGFVRRDSRCEGGPVERRSAGRQRGSRHRSVRRRPQSRGGHAAAGALSKDPRVDEHPRDYSRPVRIDSAPE